MSCQACTRGRTKGSVYTLLRTFTHDNLACSDSVKGCQLMKDALDIVYEITKLIKISPRRDCTYQTLKEEISPTSPGIRILCPTRWTVRADALRSIVMLFFKRYGMNHWGL